MNTPNALQDLKAQYADGIQKYMTLKSVQKLFPRSDAIKKWIRETAESNRFLDRIIQNNIRLKIKSE